jgi:hypothetical protein
MKSYQKFLSVLFVGIPILSFVSCKKDSGPATLVVTVKEVLSNNPKVGAEVLVFRTEEDALISRDTLLYSFTGSDGKVQFSDLKVGITYWVTAKTFLTGSTESTKTLSSGKNKLTIKIF